MAFIKYLKHFRGARSAVGPRVGCGVSPLPGRASGRVACGGREACIICFMRTALTGVSYIPCLRGVVRFIYILKHTEDVRDSASAQRATTARSYRTEVRLDPCAQLSEAGS